MFLLRILVGWIKYIGRRKVCLLLVWAGLVAVALFWSGDVERALRPPRPPSQSLHHFRRTTKLQRYMDEIEVLIEPSSCPEEVPLLTLVASAPSHVEQRLAIRSTWAMRQTTYFVMGIQGDRVDETLADNYVEAKQFGDMIVFSMADHYQNLTLKTVLMLQWTLGRCPQTRHLFKTDDDVLVNPWTLNRVLEEHPEAKLIGYTKQGSRLHRDEYNKWFVPRWLHTDDVISRYLSGTGYVINGKYLRAILEAARTTPLINLEDVYLTYLVANKALQYDLTHDARLSPYRPWVPLDCAYWLRASLHSLQPQELVKGWSRIARVAERHEAGDSVCGLYTTYFDNELLLY